MSVMPTAVPRNVLTALARLVEARSGLRFDRARLAELESKALRAFVAANCATWDAYLARLDRPDGDALFTRLLDVLTVGETYFFRDRPYFEALERIVLPVLIAQRRANRQLRLWSAGCATGEEAYSLAILVWRLLPHVDDWQISILATDLNHGFLERAEAGLYGEWSFRETDDDFKTSYFIREGPRYRIRPEIRRLVRFASLNLTDDGYPSSANGTADVDLIVCRNVLMYFAPERSHAVVARLRAALVPGGWLVLGATDPLPGLLDGFAMRSFDQAILYQRLEDPPAVQSAHKHPVSPGPSTASDASADTLAIVAAAAASDFGPRVLPPLPTAARTASVDRAGESGAPHSGWHAAWQEACLYANRGCFAEAEDWCHQAIAGSTFRPEPYYLLGTLRQIRGDDAAALVAFRQALYVDRSFVPAYLGLATVHRRAGRLGSTMQALSRARVLLQGRPSDELLLAEEGLTVGRLRDALAQALNAYPRGM